MLNVLKIKYNPENIFAVSDLHYDHDKDFIWRKRGFSSVEESNEKLVERWNQTCNESSIVFHLGDFVFGDPNAAKFEYLIKTLNFGTLFILPGNHTSGYRQKYFEILGKQFKVSNQEVYPLEYNEGSKRVVFLPNLVDVHVNGVPYVLCHYPIASWQSQGKGSIHLSGHTHSNYPPTARESGFGYQIDVGIENFGRPVSFTEIDDIIKTRNIHAVDHHGGQIYSSENLPTRK